MTPQRHWDARAAANFMLGGAGAGALAVAVLTGAAADALLALSLALVAGGLAAVWLEIGRKLRALHVFLNPFTSWMTRESFAAAVLFGAAAGYFVAREAALLYLAAAAGAAFLYCQARILRAATGIPAWRAPEAVPLVVATGIAEGAALVIAFRPAPLPLALFALAVLARAFAWARYRAAVKSEPLEAPGRALVQLGTVGALALALAGALFPPALALAAVAALVTGWRLKLALVTRGSRPQGFALPHLPVRGAR